MGDVKQGANGTAHAMDQGHAELLMQIPPSRAAMDISSCSGVIAVGVDSGKVLHIFVTASTARISVSGDAFFDV